MQQSKRRLKKRQALVKEVEANLTFAKLLAEKTQSQLQVAEKAFAEVNALYAQHDAAAKKTAEAANGAKANYDNAMKAQAAAQLAVKSAQENLSKYDAALKTASSDYAKAKANADKLVAAAKPTAEEQKQQQAAQAALNSANAALKSIEARFKQSQSSSIRIGKSNFIAIAYSHF